MKLSEMSEKDKLNLESTARAAAGLIREYDEIIDRMKNLAVSSGANKTQLDQSNPVMWCMECMATYSMVTFASSKN